MSAIRHYLRLAAALAVLACAPSAHSLIIYESGTSIDNTYNTTAPANGAPWQYVAEVVNTDPSTDASAVYLGDDYLITANHVTVNGSILLDGVSYSLDSTYTPLQIGSTDLKLIKITGDPDLSALPLTTTQDQDQNMAATMIGWGVGKGSAIPGKGWNWGSDTTQTERWGTNTTLWTTYTDNSSIFIATSFNISLGPNTAAGSFGDSGSALFENIGGTWKLAGIAADTDTFGASYYAGSPGSPNGMDNTYYVEINQYSTQIDSSAPILTGHVSAGRGDIYSAQITSGSTYAGYSLSSGVASSIHTMTGNPSGNGGQTGRTAASLLAGTASATATVNMSFDSVSASGGTANNPALASDILTLTGIAPRGTQTEGGLTVTLTDDFVLQLTYDTSQAGLVLIGQNTGSGWVNAVTLNSAQPASSAFGGSYASYLNTSQANGGGKGLSLSSQVGAYGYANGVAWAVLDHTTVTGSSGAISEYAAMVPEPGFYFMMFSGLGMLAGFRRLRSRSSRTQSVNKGE